MEYAVFAFTSFLSVLIFYFSLDKQAFASATATYVTIFMIITPDKQELCYRVLFPVCAAWALPTVVDYLLLLSACAASWHGNFNNLNNPNKLNEKAKKRNKRTLNLSKTCSICLEDVDVTVLKTFYRCTSTVSHCLHAECGMELFKTNIHPQCPMCRKELRHTKVNS
jgi:hypothetical protein